MRQFKYLTVRTKPANLGDYMTIIDVNHLNKKGIESEWHELEDKYPNDKYVSSLVTTNRKMRCF